MYYHPLHVLPVPTNLPKFEDFVELFRKTMGLGFTSDSEVSISNSTKSITFLDVDLLLTTLVQDHTTQKLVGLSRTISQKIASSLV